MPPDGPFSQILQWQASRQVDALKHNEATRRNIPTAEMESFFRRNEDAAPRPPKHYPRARPLAGGETRTAEEPSQPELIWKGAKITITVQQMKELAETGTLTLSDAQLVWRGKDRQDWSDLVVNVPPLYIQEKIHPKAIIDDLRRRTSEKREAETDFPDLFADFNGVTPDKRAEFYQHDQHWSNRLILGDSLQVMASLAERESLKGKVQCIYFDPPYGIKFNSNWQVSTQSRDVKDGKQTDISREPEQVKAFRDTWKDNIHSYLTYLRDRLTVMRDLLTESGSIFVQIGDENVHRVRAVMDEVFGENCAVSQISVFKTTTPSDTLDNNLYYVIWYCNDIKSIKVRSVYNEKPLKEWTSETKGGSWGVTENEIDRPLTPSEKSDPTVLDNSSSVYQLTDMFSAGAAKNPFEFSYKREVYRPRGNSHWKTTKIGVGRLSLAARTRSSRRSTLVQALPQRLAEAAIDKCLD